jgi:prolyl 4-hydroxylase
MGKAPNSDGNKLLAQAVEILRTANDSAGFNRGVALVENLAAAEHPDALCQLATFEAVGAARPRNWQRALECLERASIGGSDLATRQLAILGPSADIDRLLTAPGAVSLSDTPMVRSFPSFATAAECDWAINRLKGRLSRAMVWDPLTGQGAVDPVRDNSSVELRLPEMDMVLALLRARIADATRLPEHIYEVPQFMHSAVGQQFQPLFDFLDPDKPGPAQDLAARGQRIGTFLIYLNDDFEGGETIFPRIDLTFRPRKGDALFFANVTRDGLPDTATLHAGLAPTKGDKWIISQWIRDRAPGPA